jgi:hypothetical protein
MIATSPFNSTSNNCRLPLIENAFLLATARRFLRDPAYPPLNPIRSVHYFLPIIEELLDQPPPPAYFDYLRTKLAPLLTPDTHNLDLPKPALFIFLHFLVSADIRIRSCLRGTYFFQGVAGDNLTFGLRLRVLIRISVAAQRTSIQRRQATTAKSSNLLCLLSNELNSHTL